MNGLEFFTGTAPQPGTAAASGRRAEDAGWTGLTFTDSQSLSGDPYVAMTVAAAATRKLRLATGVINPLTRHPAVAASAVSSVDIESGGRAELGIGRGDSALAHIGLAPVSVARLAEYLTMLRSYLRGEAVSIEMAAGSASHLLGHGLPLHDTPKDSRLRWLRGFPDRMPVPVCVAASGPKVIRTAAKLADRVILAVGADPTRIAWGLSIAREVNPDVRIGAYVNVVVDDDIERARSLAAGGITSFARFSVMHGKVNGPVSDSDRETLEGLPGDYEMSKHFQSANHAVERGLKLAEKFAIIGSAAFCCERLLELSELGVDRFYLIGPSRDSDREAAMAASKRFIELVLPKLAVAL